LLDLGQSFALASEPGDGATYLEVAEQGAVATPHSPDSGNGHRLLPMVSPNSDNWHRPALTMQHKPRTASSNRLIEWQTLNVEGVAALADDVSCRIPQPVDSFEVTALLESLGITDDVAQQRYGTPDAFSLAEAVLAQIRACRVPTGAQDRKPEPSQPAYPAWRDYARGPLALIPMLALLLIIEAYRVLGNWNESHILALSLGMTSSMLILNGFIQAISRRSSIYLGLNNPSAASRFLRVSVTAAGICNIMIAILAVLVATGLGVFTPNDRIIFGLAFVGFSAIWLMAAGLLLMQATGWLGIGLAAGLVAGVMTDRAIAPLLSAHLALATVVGFGVAMGLTLHAAVKHGLDAKASGQPDRVKLPPVAYLVYEAAPYFAYGSLYMVFILIPHLLGWFGVLGMGQERGWALSSVEVGLVLSLPPLILSSGIAEHALRQFWLQARAAQPITPGSDPRRFGFVLTELYRRQLERYLMVLAGTSAMAYVVFQLALGSGLLASWLRLSNLNATMFFFYISLIIYGLLGWGQFNGAFCVTLGRPALALRAVLLGIGIVVVTGIPLSLGLNFTYAAIAFITGAITFVAVSSWNVKKVLESADYYYFSSS